MSATKSQIFIRLVEKQKIEKVINKIPVTNIENPDFNSKARTYLTFQAINFLQVYYPYLQFKNYEVYAYPYLPRYLFLLLLTNPNTNHPFLLYVNLDDNLLNFILPIGKDAGQVELKTIWDAIPECTGIELFALFLYLERSIFVRKDAILNNKQFTLLNCTNITNCIRKSHEIDKMKISQEKKQALYDKYNNYYLHKALDFLKYYFDLLDASEYDEAYYFLKGDTNTKKYFKKERLNTFFKDTKTIIGHLQIFIALYQLMNHLKSLVFNLN
jgi:hypothetical protein